MGIADVVDVVPLLVLRMFLHFRSVDFAEREFANVEILLDVMS
jgi:hypothetical protein